MAKHSNSSLTIELLPQDERVDLRLDAFLEELGALKGALRETERLVSGRDPSLFFTIKRLQKQSPALVELEAVSDVTAEDGRSHLRFASHVVKSLTANLRIIGTRIRPRRIDVPTLTAYEEMTKPLQRHGLEVIVRSGNASVTINSAFREALHSVMGEDEVAYGSISGRIEGMTTHSRNVFRLYPIVGASRIIGSFARKDRAKFAAGMDKYVTVWGNIKYKTWDRFPYAIHAEDIDVHDPAGHTLLDLRGLNPRATGDLTTQQFLDELRDE